MKRTTLILGFASLFILLTAMKCDKDDTADYCENTKLELLEFKTSIESLANTSVCGGGFECRYISFGSKPCGGPWDFLIYSTSIDTLTLQSLVAEYNQMEANYNLNCNMASDCSTPQPPVGFECENNQCIPVY
ncbi:hypothetical protein M0G43_03390 [Subsaxibacter sp. CAU 1640]|uniref:hypothetical protein n=1 Tax=Subsaxibacter sp. CAU 1640 TaxID=2933271 RepID=UPI00200367D4|nr:hypothetical protein [Subsaxibacter sp. CAU 1640]MCK7589612.1 hypothetical protein [Subsaxibacter sp. CAU 1640]